MTTEELKREMFGRLHLAKLSTPTPVQEQDVGKLEEALEAYLEALRQEATQLKSDNDHGFKTLMMLREERDQLRNKLQAFEYANKSAGEFLIEAQAKIKRQRQSIGQLKNDRDNARNLAGSNYTKYQKARQELAELRKMIGSTIAQNRKENRSYTCPSSPEGHEMSSEGMCTHCNEIITRAMP